MTIKNEENGTITVNMTCEQFSNIYYALIVAKSSEETWIENYPNNKIITESAARNVETFTEMIDLFRNPTYK